MKRLVQNNKLLQRDDVIFTPHMAYNNAEAIEQILDTTVENVRTYFTGEPNNEVVASGVPD